ncbi:MAG: hypothetical protein EHM64_06665 [Ignavibacteriae bacterium]|nr:MAG: hypothetical protein EHM64_06665 [Ignavibacteriota bacterium]
MNRSKLFTFIVLVVLIAGCSHAKWVSNDFERYQSGVDSVSILFPLVEYSEKSGEEKNVKIGHSVFISRKVAEVLKSIIDKDHFIAQSAVVISDSAIIDRWLPRFFSKSTQKAKQFNDSLLRAKETIGMFPVIPEMRLLTDKVTTKLFLFVNGTAFGTTEETKQNDIQQAQTFDLLYDHPFAYDYQWSGLQLHMYLVETKTMKLLWSHQNDYHDTKYDPIKEEEIKNLCRKLIQIN